MKELTTIPKLECLTRFKERIIAGEQTHILKKARYASLWKAFLAKQYEFDSEIGWRKSVKMYEEILADELIENGFGGLICFSTEGIAFDHENVLAISEDGEPFAMLKLGSAKIRYPSHPLEFMREYGVFTNCSSYGFDSKDDYYKFADKHFGERVALDLSFRLVKIIDKGKVI